MHINHNLTVLIVEDDPHVLLGCQQALALEDIASEGVGSAEEALARVGSDFAGIVISDIRLPGINGLQLPERLKAIDASLPVGDVLFETRSGLAQAARGGVLPAGGLIALLDKSYAAASLPSPKSAEPEAAAPSILGDTL